MNQAEATVDHVAAANLFTEGRSTEELRILFESSALAEDIQGRP